MKSSTYYKLNVILRDLVRERDQLQGQIDENNLQIYETQSFALELLGKDDDDFKFFSPRKMSDIHKDELEQFSEKKAEYERQNKGLIAEKNKLEDIIDLLQKISEESEIDDSDLSADSDLEGDLDDELDNDIIDGKLNNDSYDDLNKDLDNNLDNDLDSNLDNNLNNDLYNDLDSNLDNDSHNDLYNGLDSDLDNDSHNDLYKGLNSNFDKFSVLKIQEVDRQRTARDLQDFLLDNLVHLVHKYELSEKFIRQDPMRAQMELAAATKDLNAVTGHVREIISDFQLCSVDHFSLKESFEQIISEINKDSLYDIDLELEDVSCENILMDVTLFRVVHECLYNIYQHADAKKILFHCVKTDGKCVIRIEDDGRGFVQEEIDKEKNHFGIFLVKGWITLLDGKIEIDSKPDDGTKIRIEIPEDSNGYICEST